MKSVVVIFSLVIGTSAFGQARSITAKSPTEFVPAGYVVLEQIQGDLNNDNQQDYVLIIKGTDKANFVTDERGRELDRNRRGIIIALRNTDSYELALENRSCFSSENEDGGIYFPPDLGVSINEGNLVFHYGHGRYGSWTYTFQYQHADFELISYRSNSNRGPMTLRTVSINFMTKEKLIRRNVDEYADMKEMLGRESGDEYEEDGELFIQTLDKFTLSKPIKLRDIADFDDFDLRSLIRVAK